MAFTGRSLCLFSAIWILTIQLTLALELVEIRPGGGLSGKLQKRDTSSLDLRSVESFLWGADDASSRSLANLTIFTPENNERVLSMENFDGMLLSCSGTPSGLELQFDGDESFSYAQGVWDWVNGADNRSFIMVAGAGNCDGNPYRVPYSVSDIAYDESQNIAILNATTGPWEDLATAYQLRVGNVELPPSNGAPLGRRDITTGVSFPLANNIDFVAQIEQGPLVGELACEACSTTGQINFEIIVTQNVIGIPDGVDLRLTPQGVSAIANLRLSLESTFLSGLEIFSQTLLSFPLAAITIPPNILNIGPFFEIDVGLELTSAEGSIAVSSNVTSTISDAAVLRANLFDVLDNEFSGWEPTLDFGNPEIEAQISATLQAFLMPALRLKAEALGQGIEAALELKLPFVELTLEASANSEGGVCGDPENTVGVEVDAAIGAELSFSAGTADGLITPVDITIAEVSFPLGELCFGTNLGGQGQASPALGGYPNVTATSQGPSGPSATAVPDTKCNATNGMSGSCISTSACSMYGGMPEAGHCPGGSDIQCCVQTPQFGPSCRTDTGSFGACISTTACVNGNAQSVPGFCDGAADIQCCIPKVQPAVTNYA